MRDILRGRRGDRTARLIRSAAWALSVPYAALLGWRRERYRRHPAKSRSAGVPVISVGNITTGGTGKTPMVAWVVKRLLGAGHKPAILTRGYMAGGGPSDEAQLLSKISGMPGQVNVIVNPDRVAGASQAVAAGADVLVMDDGFQHRRLRRDLDIVLIDALNPFGYEHCLPRGLLREPLTALADADAIVITHSDLIEPAELDALRKRISALAPAALITLARHAPTSVLAPDDDTFEPELLEGLRVLAFCALGNPDAFFATLAKLGCDVVSRVAFDDHAPYNAVQIDRIYNAVSTSHAQVMITTAKDKVKILPAQAMPLPLFVLNMEMRLTEGEAALWEKIAARLRP